jgi:predicted transcriptional regulator
MVQATMIEALPPKPAPACDRDNCGETAVFQYVFAWGESGVCCARHAQLLQQIADQTARSIVLSALRAPEEAPMQRSERTLLKAHSLVVEEELNEAKGRGLELYRANVDLTQQVQTLKVRERECNAQLKDRDARIRHLEGALEERDTEHAELTEEIGRLRTLETFVRAPEVNPAG